jgi:steroid 5-alpha reductase family enzyme
MDNITAFGLFAVTAMLVTYALEERRRVVYLGLCWSVRLRLDLRVSAGCLAVRTR